VLPDPAGPLTKFEASMDGISQADQDRFYAGNMCEMLGQTAVGIA
jgi:hypothetical protein